MDPQPGDGLRDGPPLILIIDGSPSKADELRELLHEMNLRIMCAEDGQTALSIAEKYHPNAILLNTTLPDRPGGEVCCELKNRLATADTPVLMIHDEARDESLVGRCFDVGAHDVLCRPIARTELAGRLRVVLRESDIREAYKRLAVQDAATGLANRRHFILHVTEAILRTRRSSSESALIIGDIDGLAAINDRYGHDLGDEVILTFSRLLRRLCSPLCKAGRIGGDEFAMVLMDTPRGRAISVARRLQQVFSAVAFDAATDPKHFFASFGVAHFDGAGADFHVDDFLRSADHALYAAKESGHGRVIAHWQLDAATLGEIPSAKRHARHRARVPTQRAFVIPPAPASQKTPAIAEPPDGRTA